MTDAATREAYRKEMEERLARWVDDIESIQERARADTSHAYSAELETLEFQFQKFYARLDQLEAVQDSVWAEWKHDVDEIAGKLGQTIERLDAQLPQQTGKD